MTKLTQSEASAAATGLAAPPPRPPRALTARGSRRAWVEPGVRAWWFSALLLAIIGAWFVVSEVRRSSLDRRLIRGGTAAQALIIEINGSARQDRVFRPAEQAEFTMLAKVPGRDQLVQIKGRLKDQRKDLRVAADAVRERWLAGESLNQEQQDQLQSSSVSLYVDRDNPAALWTDRQQASLQQDLLLGLIIVPFVNLLLIVAVIQRIRVLRTWREGEALAAIVVEVRQAPSAPLSRLIRFTLRDVRDRRVFRAIVPPRIAPLRAGDAFWVIARPHRPQEAIVAALYQ